MTHPLEDSSARTTPLLSVSARTRPLPTSLKRDVRYASGGTFKTPAKRQRTSGQSDTQGEDCQARPGAQLSPRGKRSRDQTEERQQAGSDIDWAAGKQVTASGHESTRSSEAEKRAKRQRMTESTTVVLPEHTQTGMPSQQEEQQGSNLPRPEMGSSHTRMFSGETTDTEEGVHASEKPQLQPAR